MSVVLRKDVTVIVSTIVVKDNKLLLVQESKSTCYGDWYLPAGRLEKYETLSEGAKRELIEESGIEVELISVLCVEMRSREWIRVTFVGRAIGGSLKEKPDKESLRAAWIALEDVDGLPLRSKDFLRVLALWARTWRDPGLDMTRLMPIETACSDVVLQVCAIDDRGRVLIEASGQLPVIILQALQPFHLALAVFYQTHLSRSLEFAPQSVPLRGLQFGGSNRQHSPRPNTDGLKMQVVLGIPSGVDLMSSSPLSWQQPSPPIELTSLATFPLLTVPL